MGENRYRQLFKKDSKVAKEIFERSEKNIYKIKKNIKKQRKKDNYENKI